MNASKWATPSDSVGINEKFADRVFLLVDFWKALS
jgi:hypothetical protein